MINLPVSDNHEQNRDAFPCHGDNAPCAVCGKEVRHPKHYLHLHLGGGTVVTEEEADRLNATGESNADLGLYPIGADCLRRNPELKQYAVTLPVTGKD